MLNFLCRSKEKQSQLFYRSSTVSREAVLFFLLKLSIFFSGGDWSDEEEGGRDSITNTRPLVNIWIPTAFLLGKSPDIHHVYQVGIVLNRPVS